MTTKTEERIKVLLDEHYEYKMNQVDEKIINSYSGIFLLGFMVGSLLSYMNLFTIILSFMLGVFTCKKDPFMINKIFNKLFNIITNIKIYASLDDLLKKK